MKKRRSHLPAGILLILIGSLLLFFGSAKRVELVINGERRIIDTRASRVFEVLEKAGVDYRVTDQIRPGLTERVRNGSRISLNRTASISLDDGKGTGTRSYLSHQLFGGNILLDAGVRLYPGDRLFWNDGEIRPDFNLGGVSELNLRLEQANVFLLVTEQDPEGKTAYGAGDTVRDALESAGIKLSGNTRVFPEPDTPFIPGMTVEVLPIHELTVSRDGTLVTVSDAGINVGEALARAGMPLMNSDISIPASGEPLPADGRILIVPVSDIFTMKAETIRGETEWTADDSMDLDDTRLITEGRDGLKGTFRRVRTENRQTVLDETSPETVLVRPLNGKQAYGTKINIRTVNTPDGPVEYYRAINVYATSYSPCRSGTSSCITGTASGRKVEKGIAAVTSAWYKRFAGQSVYIPDYGTAVIADVGGGIAGKNWIDLAYSDDDFVGWSKDTTLYFLTPVPADMVWVLQ